MSGRIRVAPKEARTLEGITFASRAEMNRYAYLRILEVAGEISKLELQPAFVLEEAHVRGGVKERKITYVADFRYLDKESGLLVVEDVKGHRTEVYKLKRKLLLARYPDIHFREVRT